MKRKIIIFVTVIVVCGGAFLLFALFSMTKTGTTESDASTMQAA